MKKLLILITISILANIVNAQSYCKAYEDYSNATEVKFNIAQSNFETIQNSQVKFIPVYYGNNEVLYQYQYNQNNQKIFNLQKINTEINSLANSINNLSNTVKIINNLMNGGY